MRAWRKTIGGKTTASMIQMTLDDDVVSSLASPYLFRDLIQRF